MAVGGLTLRADRARAVEVPMTYVLGTSAAAVRAAPLLLVDLETHEGVTGRTYLFCYTRAAAAAIVPMLDDAASTLSGQALEPSAWWATLSKRYTLIGVQGIVRMAMAAIDTAAWDAQAIAAGVPLATFLGAAPKPIPAYNSCGLGLMVDYNQALTVAEAITRGHALDQHDVVWIEEPIRHDDIAGNARLAQELMTPIQLGENFSQPFAMHEALDRRACDYVMPDLERIGGVTGWREAAATQRISEASMVALW